MCLLSYFIQRCSSCFLFTCFYIQICVFGIFTHLKDGSYPPVLDKKVELASQANINRNSQVSFEQKQIPAFRIEQGYYEKPCIACAGFNKIKF